LLSQLKISVACEMLRAKDLLDLLETLKKVEVPALILKGAAIAYTHYPEPYLRSRCDTDIFIHPADIRKIRDALLSCGYTLRGQIYKTHQFNGYKNIFGGALNYDVHWRVSNNAQYSRVFSFEQAQSDAVSITGLKGAFSLNPSRTLLLACMHRSGNVDHDPNRLIWIYDIHILVSTMPENELLEFAQWAVDANIQAECLEGIDKSSEYYDTKVPNSIRNVLLTPTKITTFRDRFVDSALGLIIEDIKQLPDTRARIELFCNYFFPSKDYLLNKFQKKNAAWIPFLYLRYVVAGFFKRVLLR